MQNKTVINFFKSHVNELKKGSMIEMISEAAFQMNLTGEALQELQSDKKFLFLLGQIAELHAILYLAKIEPKRIKVIKKKVVKPKVKPKKKKARK